MRQGKQFGVSANEKNDVWRRWKAGASLHEIGRVFDKPHSSMTPFVASRRDLPPPVVAHCSRSPWLSERASPEGLLAVRRFERSPDT